METPIGARLREGPIIIHSFLQAVWDLGTDFIPIDSFISFVFWGRTVTLFVINFGLLTVVWIFPSCKLDLLFHSLRLCSEFYQLSQNAYIQCSVNYFEASKFDSFSLVSVTTYSRQALLTISLRCKGLLYNQTNSQFPSAKVKTPHMCAWFCNNKREFTIQSSAVELTERGCILAVSHTLVFHTQWFEFRDKLGTGVKQDWHLSPFVLQIIYLQFWHSNLYFFVNCFAFR